MASGVRGHLGPESMYNMNWVTYSFMRGRHVSMQGTLQGGMGWMEMCPALVLTLPEATGSETLLLTCHGVAGCPALDSGVTGHR